MTDRLQKAFDAAPRRQFLPLDQRHLSDLDAPLAIGHGATNSQPSTMRFMLELLDAQPGQRVLDVGSGSGWTTALLAELVGADGLVIGVDITPELVSMGRTNLGGGRPWARVELAQPSVLGWPAEAPFDRILVSADGGRVPPELEDQLAPDGRMVLPADREMVVVHRRPDGAVRRRRAKGLFSFVPLR
ncbi:methyltransferase domain-containing protein [Tessaracoccus sp. MC1627]|uniref:protein-L-isoaspartate O-methyltransferase family protein n=1 Tax=Tessaracoccus sp. MC1627 TaxID=2760312 RepID=UPI0016033444|nr:methyltransferase domain-containing protein [Tessaracoccus sp. MC1627]MBB1513941.1 methyltransferase domain-containing protein [Tessaracoccus sp. MC1627]